MKMSRKLNTWLSTALSAGILAACAPVAGPMFNPAVNPALLRSQSAAVPGGKVFNPDARPRCPLHTSDAADE